MEKFSLLQLREVFHLEFLKWLGRSVIAADYALKGGVNLRFFFKSFRYSEDMNLDARSIKVFQLRDAVMGILGDKKFQDNLRPFGIAGIVTHDAARSKQTETTQRFKVHLHSYSGEDLFTKIEFSRRGFNGNAVIEPVEPVILRAYKMAPLLVSHYDSYSAVTQKLRALAVRTEIQARDIFDLYVLASQYNPAEKRLCDIRTGFLSKAYERVFEVEFAQFRDTVVAYLSSENQAVYDNPKTWEEVRLKVIRFIEEIKGSNA
ncbi:MAG: nucleotidyl transferase AbiEii/AbiGii toxin family protein [Candidatus Omnitrophota bacterium]